MSDKKARHVGVFFLAWQSSPSLRDKGSGDNYYPEIPMNDIREIADKCHQTAKDKGWWDNFDGRNMTIDEIAAKLCLIHSEVSEALEDLRTGDMVFLRDDNGKPVGFPSELADIVIRVFDLCGFMDIDIAHAILEKMAYNDTRKHRHGGKAL